MIDIHAFENTVIQLFSDQRIIVDHFKEDVTFIDIDCFPDQSYMLTLALSTSDIRVATVSKIPELDFSLYDYVFHTEDETEKLLLLIKQTGKFPKCRE